MSRGMTVFLLAVIVILMAALALVLLRYRRMEKFANRTMIQVDNMLEQLILGREVKCFSENEDTLLGKFQTRAGRLYDIHRAQEQREKELRDQISRSVSDLVHQINTPIANIKMYSEFLKEDALTTEERRHFADNLERQARKLSWLGKSFTTGDGNHLSEAGTAAGTSGGFVCCGSGIVKGGAARKRYLSGRTAGSESLSGQKMDRRGVF